VKASIKEAEQKIAQAEESYDATLLQEWLIKNGKICGWHGCSLQFLLSCSLLIVCKVFCGDNGR
jgi:hypothetical protein